MSDWLQTTLPYAPSDLPHMRRLPGTVPLADLPWLMLDEAFAPQMRLRDKLVADRRADVLTTCPGSENAVDELCAEVLARLARTPGYSVDEGTVRRPDGVQVPRDLSTIRFLGRVVQEDLCVLQKDPAGEHVLTAAALCFPAHWTLSEKIGRPLSGIHRPVASYDADIARRVQRMFDMIRPGQGLWRFNLHGQDSPDLFSPRREAETKPRVALRPRYLRSERQVILRLPRTGAVVFSIHTWLIARKDARPGEIALVDRAEAAG